MVIKREFNKKLLILLILVFLAGSLWVMHLNAPAINNALVVAGLAAYAHCEGSADSCSTFNDNQEICTAGGCSWQDSCYGSVNCGGLSDESTCSSYGCTWSDSSCSGSGYDCLTWNGDSSACTAGGCSWQDSCYGSVSACTEFADETTCALYGCTWKTQPSCGETITNSVTLSSDMDCSGEGTTGLIVGADNIRIDCAGHSIKGSSSYDGIYLIGRTGVTVKNCDISGFARGVFLRGSSNNRISNNSVHDNSWNNIELRFDSNNNHISYNNADGAYVGINIKSSTGNLVYGNTASNNDAAGIRIATSSGNDIYDNTVKDNNGDIGNGIDLSSSSNVNIYDNIIESNKKGIFSASSSDNRIETNTISGNCEGMRLTASSGEYLYDNDFTGNNAALLDFCGSGGDTGLYVESGSYAEIVDGSFSNNGNFGIYVEGTIDWQVEEEASCTSNAIYFVTDHDPISEEITRTSCPILPDEYTEESLMCGDVISEDLTLTEPLICSGEYTYGLEIGAEDITIDCNGWGISGSGFGTGIYVNAYSRVTVKNCDISNFNNGVEIYSSSDSEINKNNIHNNQDNGIYVDLSDNLQILDNGIRNNDGFGVFIEGEDISSGHTIKGNIINGNNIECGEEGCAGILLLGEDNCVIEDNEVSRNYYGIVLLQSYDNSVLNNVLEGNFHSGIALFGGNNNDISGNEITDSGNVGIWIRSNAEDAITNNVIRGDGTFQGWSWEGSFGIYFDNENGDAEGNVFSSNEISGNYYGAYFQNYDYYDHSIEDLTLENEEVFGNAYGIYFNNAGSSDGMPIIKNSKIYDNEDKGISLISSYVTIEDTDFTNNGPGEEERTGLYVDYDSHVNLLNGNFEDNGEYALYAELGALSAEWTITKNILCKNNNIWIGEGWIALNGGYISAENCAITVEGHGLELSEGEQGYLPLYVDTSGDGSATFGGPEKGVEIEIQTNTGYSNTVTVTSYNQNPGGSGYSLSALGKWIKIESVGEIDLASAVIKVYYSDSEIIAAGLDESTLRLEYYDEGTGTWTVYDSPNGGVNTVDNYVWASSNHFSIWGIFGSAPPSETASGGGATGGAAYGTYTITAEQLLAGYTREFAVKGGVKFTISGVSHSVKVLEILQNRAVLTVASDSQNVTFLTGEEKKFDFNSDEIYDLSIRLDSINPENKTISITLLGISESIPSGGELTPGIAGPETSGEVPSPSVRPSLVFMVLIVAILLVVIAIIIWAAVRMFRAKARSESMKESERIAQTQEFVREARRRGYKDNEVREMFVKKGWTDEEINSRAGL